MKMFHGCVIDTANGHLVDAGEITVHENGAIVVAHRQQDGSLLTTPHGVNANFALLLVPPISQN